MWNRITYEFLDSYMKFLYVKTNHIWNLYVKTYHIWNRQFIYEILYVKTNHIWNLYVKTNHIWNSICENKSHMKPSIHIWNSICKNKSHIKSPIRIWISIRENKSYLKSYRIVVVSYQYSIYTWLNFSHMHNIWIFAPGIFELACMLLLIIFYWKWFKSFDWLRAVDEIVISDR